MIMETVKTGLLAVEKVRQLLINGIPFEEAVMSAFNDEHLFLYEKDPRQAIEGEKVFIKMLDECNLTP